MIRVAWDDEEKGVGPLLWGEECECRLKVTSLPIVKTDHGDASKFTLILFAFARRSCSYALDPEAQMPP